MGAFIFQLISEFLPERVLGPVLDALVPMKVEIQQNVARIIIKTCCGAWLEHIRNRRIKFRYLCHQLHMTMSI